MTQILHSDMEECEKRNKEAIDRCLRAASQSTWYYLLLVPLHVLATFIIALICGEKETAGLMLGFALPLVTVLTLGICLMVKMSRQTTLKMNLNYLRACYAEYKMRELYLKNFGEHRETNNGSARPVEDPRSGLVDSGEGII